MLNLSIAVAFIYFTIIYRMDSKTYTLFKSLSTKVDMEGSTNHMSEVTDYSHRYPVTILFLSCLFVCLSVCLFVCLFVRSFSQHWY